MATDLTLPLPSAPAQKLDDSLGIDRAFVLSMARVPVLAAAWVAVAWLADQAFRQFAPERYAGFGPMAVLCVGMVLAAVIDGWAFKVPNWLTLSLVVSGWYIGILHDCGVNIVPGFAPEATGGVGSALLGTALGFALLFPMLFIQGMGSFKSEGGLDTRLRTEQDLSIKVVIVGSAILVGLMVLLPQIPGDSILQKMLIGVLVIIFGFFFVTVSSRIVGIIGSSSNPISGMTIATLMATSLVFICFGLTGHLFEPMVLVVGGIVCIAAANGGATSQDLKTGYIVGATPKNQQICLFVGAVLSSIVIGLTVKLLDHPSPDMMAKGIVHAIGSDKFPAPQGTLMATLIKGMLSFNLDWNFVLVGVFLAITMELCGVNALNFAVGAYLPLSTTLPIFVGGVVRKAVEFAKSRRGEKSEDDDLGSGSLFATGLVAGGALAGVIVALLCIPEPIYNLFQQVSAEHALTGILGEGGYQGLGVVFYATLCFILFKIALKGHPASSD